jgi:hypothetical protein
MCCVLAAADELKILEKREMTIIRATEFLARETPLWLLENDCRSCHHNGDAARALHEAMSRGFPVPAESLADSHAWLARPADWLEQNQAEYADEGLAVIQFASGLATAAATGAIREPDALREAAGLVAARQSESGAYIVEPRDAPGSPVTYGTALATAMALEVWEIEGAEAWEASRRNARAWLTNIRGPRVLDSAAVLLALGSEPKGVDEEEAVERALSLLRRAQGTGGGWGTFADSPPEAFDTALVLWAMSKGSARETGDDWVLRGVAYLVAAQEPDGGWPATTRPAGGDSYAQRISTTAWSLIALLSWKPPETAKRRTGNAATRDSKIHTTTIVSQSILKAIAKSSSASSGLGSSKTSTSKGRPG